MRNIKYPMATLNLHLSVTAVGPVSWTFLAFFLNGVNASVFKALPDVFWSECLGECLDKHTEELGPSHASTSNLEVIGYQFLLVLLFQCSIWNIIQRLEDVGAVGGGRKQ